jgi:hypothetical protein
MRDDLAVEVESTKLLRTLIRNACVMRSPRIPHTEYPLMFHGHNERVDVESLRVSAQMWETLCRDFLG